MLLLPIFGVCSKPSVDCPVVVIDCPGPTVSCPQPGNLEPGIFSDPLHQPGVTKKVSCKRGEHVSR